MEIKIDRKRMEEFVADKHHGTVDLFVVFDEYDDYFNDDDMLSEEINYGFAVESSLDAWVSNVKSCMVYNGFLYFGDEELGAWAVLKTVSYIYDHEEEASKIRSSLPTWMLDISVIDNVFVRLGVF